MHSKPAAKCFPARISDCFCGVVLDPCSLEQSVPIIAFIVKVRQDSEDGLARKGHLFISVSADNKQDGATSSGPLWSCCCHYPSDSRKKDLLLVIHD